MVGALFFLAFAALCAVLTWTGYSTSRVTVRRGRAFVTKAGQPRYFMTLLLLRAAGVLFFLALALAFALGWLPPKD